VSSRHYQNAIASCVSCHIRVPHGGKVSRLRLTANAPARYGATGTSTSTNFVSWGAPGSPISGFKTSCSEHSGQTGTQAW
jgi:hypothetical protein